MVRRFVREALSKSGGRKGCKKFTRFGDYARHLKELALAIPTRATRSVALRPVRLGRRRDQRSR